VRVQVDPNKLASKQIGINEVDNSIRDWNVNLPTGALWGRNQSYNIQATGQLMNAAAYRPLVVAWRNGSPVRLEQVADISDSVEDTRSASWIYRRDRSQRNISLMVMRQPDANTIEVADKVKKLLPVFQAQLPPSVELIVASDWSKQIRESFQDIKFTMMITLGLVVSVIFLFLRKLSATVIPSLALPFSVVGTFGIMYLLSFSLNNLSMMALILCIAFVVDDAIVMLENIVRHIEKGEAPLAAALRGSKEIGFTIVSMTVSLAAVFIPLLFMGGTMGRLFREFAVTITTAILISGVVSVTLTPMLCSRLLRPAGQGREGFLGRGLERMFQGLLRVYDLSLRWVLLHRPVMLVVFVGVLGATGYLYMVVPKGFIPEADNGSLMGQLEAAQGTSFDQMSTYAREVGQRLIQDPDIDNISVSTGASGFGSNGFNTGRVMIELKPRSERATPIAPLVQRLRGRVAGLPGVRAYLTVPSAIRFGGRMSRSQYQFTLQAPDTDELYARGRDLEAEIGKLPIVQDVTSDLEMRNPRINLTIDRDRVAALHLNPMQIQQALYSAYGPRWTSTIYGAKSQYRVLVEMLPQFQAHPDSLSLLYFKSSDNRLVPLDSVAKFIYDAAPNTINHSGQLPAVTISFNMKPGVPLGSAVDEIQALADKTLPSTISTSFQGNARAFQDSLKNLSTLLLLAIAVVYIVLGVLYESYIHPLTILSGLPSAGLGALLTLLIFKVELSIYAFVGLIMLIGLVKKNAIMQIDFALDAQRREGKSAAEAIYEGCLIRFRPIMMTTMAALLGALPLAVGWGAGGESRRPLGLTVAGGLVFSQLITLYMTPVVYTYLAGVGQRRGARRPQAAPVAVAGD
jgi:hydrophobe/amphiphile efflux-1 (HAE1) family protein